MAKAKKMAIGVETLGTRGTYTGGGKPAPQGSAGFIPPAVKPDYVDLYKSIGMPIKELPPMSGPLGSVGTPPSGPVNYGQLSPPPRTLNPTMMKKGGSAKYSTTKMSTHQKSKKNSSW